MKIAIMSDQADLGGRVPDCFSRSPFLLIVDAEKGDLLEVIAREEDVAGQDVFFAREILRWDCEGVLCGPIEREPFVIIADEGCVTRYNAAGMGAREALERMNRRALELVRDYIGGAGCQGEHHKEDAAYECCRHHDE